MADGATASYRAAPDAFDRSARSLAFERLGAGHGQLRWAVLLGVVSLICVELLGAALATTLVLSRGRLHP